MSEHDEGYIIIERRTGNFGTFVWGALIGATAALLFAPRSGSETRQELSEGVNRLRDQAEDKVREVQAAVNDTVGDVRRQFEEGVASARRAVETGKEAARTSRAEMEHHLRESGRAFRSGFEAARTGAHGPDADRPATDEGHDDATEL